MILNWIRDLIFVILNSFKFQETSLKKEEASSGDEDDNDNKDVKYTTGSEWAEMMIFFYFGCLPILLILPNFLVHSFARS